MTDTDRFSSTFLFRRKRGIDSVVGSSSGLTKKRQAKEILVIDDDSEDDKHSLYIGSGSRTEPIYFPEWTTGNVIADEDHGIRLDLSDDEDEHSGKVTWLEPHESINRNLPRTSRSGPSAWQLLESSRSLGHGIEDHANSDEVNEQEEEDKGDCVICEEVRLRPGKTPWTFSIADEPVEESPPTLSFSQKSGSDYLETPTSSQPLPDLGEDQDLSDETNMLDMCNVSSLNLSPTENSTLQDFTSQPAEEFKYFEEEEVWDQKLCVQVRKQLFYTRYWRQERSSLANVLRQYQDCAEGKDSEDNCWLYRGPRIYRDNRTLAARVRFRHDRKTEKIYINVALLAMLLEGLLTEDHKEGIIKHSWQASHLCGNWTCVNPRHVNPEPGVVNNGRNPCLRNIEGPCDHTPPCLKHLKVELEELRLTVPSHDKSSQREAVQPCKR